MNVGRRSGLDILVICVAGKVTVTIELSRLNKLAASARSKGHWALYAAAQAAIDSDGSVDDQINVVGALHETGYLRNSLAPYWRAWRTSPAAFADSCVSRLSRGDSDYWALAALLGMAGTDVVAAVRRHAMPLLTVRRYTRLDGPEVHVGVFAARSGSAILTPVLEIGCDAETGELIDMMRWRAVVIERESATPSGVTVEGGGSYFMRARLPHGCWRVLHDRLCVSEADLVPASDTLFGRE